jgi:ubiquinone biosynthesis protein COQ9
MILLPYGGKFEESDLVAHIRSTGRNYIIQGQQAASEENHSKPKSLDYWLRQFATNPDTKQAENSVMELLEKTGYFKVESNLLCPDSGRRCKGLRLLI